MNGQAFNDVSFSLYTTLVRGDGVVLPEDQLQSLTPQPWDDRFRRIESGRDEQGVMSTLLKTHHDIRLGDCYPGRGIDEVLKQMPRLGVLVAMADAAGQPIFEWDSRDTVVRHTYDGAHRPVGVYVTASGAAEVP